MLREGEQYFWRNRNLLNCVQKEKGRVVRKFIIVLFILLILTLFSTMGFRAFLHLTDERQRGADEVHSHLSLIANARSSAVNQWIRSIRDDITSIATDTTVRLYLDTVLSDTDNAQAERGYLENLLAHQEQKGGFMDSQDSVKSGAGLALVDLHGNLLISGSAFSPPNESWQLIHQQINKIPPSQVMLTPFIDSSGVRMFLLIHSINPVQFGRDGPPLGYLVALRRADELVGLLRQPGDALYSLVTMAATAAGLPFTVCCSEQGKEAIDHNQSDQINPSLEEWSRSLHNQQRDKVIPFTTSDGRRQLGLTLPLDESSLHLLLAVSRQEVFGRYDETFRSSLIQLALWGGVLLLLILFVWRYGVSVRLSRALQEKTDFAQALEYEMDLFNSLTDAYPNIILVVNPQGSIIFANRALAEKSSLSPEQIVGRELRELMGTADAARIMEHVHIVLETGSNQSFQFTTDQTAGGCKCHYQLILLKTRNVMAVETDVTQDARI